MEIWAVKDAEEAKEEEMDKATVQAAMEVKDGEDHKSSHSRHRNSKPANRHSHKQRLKRDRQESVSTVRATTTSASFLITPQIKKHSCLSKSRRGGMVAMVVMTKITTLMLNTTMAFVASKWKDLQVIWKELYAW